MAASSGVCGLGGQVRSGQSRLVLPGHCPGSRHQCQVQGPTLSLQKARGAADGWGWDGGTEKGGGGGDRQLPTAETPALHHLDWECGQGGANAPFILPSPMCPSMYSSLCSGTSMSMGTATSHRRSSRSSVGTFLTSAPLGTSTRTSEEAWGQGERESRLTSPWVLVSSRAR